MADDKMEIMDKGQQIEVKFCPGCGAKLEWVEDDGVVEPTMVWCKGCPVTLMFQQRGNGWLLERHLGGTPVLVRESDEDEWQAEVDRRVKNADARRVEDALRLMLFGFVLSEDLEMKKKDAVQHLKRVKNRTTLFNAGVAEVQGNVVVITDFYDYFCELFEIMVDQAEVNRLVTWGELVVFIANHMITSGTGKVPSKETVEHYFDQRKIELVR